MTAMCAICGQLVEAPPILMLIARGTTSEDEVRQRAQDELGEFDRLAGRMLGHVNLHHSDMSAEMSAAMFLAGKVYAMHWATSTGTKFGLLLSAWRAQVVGMLACQETGAEADGGAPGEASAPPEGSNSKKS